MLTHVHSCRYCDRTFSHSEEYPLDNRPIPKTCAELTDISRFHGCLEGIVGRRRVAIILSSSGRSRCKYSCDRPCSHPPKERKPN